MSRLLLVRHGQAAFSLEHYGGLTPVGRAQAKALGKHFAAHEPVVDRVFVGPKERHIETEIEVRAVHASASRRWPEAEPLAALDEYPAERLVRAGLATHDDAEATKPPEPIAHSAEARRGFGRLFEATTRAWVRGELSLPDIGTWREFRERVQAGLAFIAAAAGRGQTVIAFTSGGVIAAAVGLALLAADETVLALSWQHQNAAFTELLFSRGRFALRRFNVPPPFPSDSLFTER